MVRVPVLSNTMVFTMENFSKIFPPRKSNPLVAPNEVPTSTAVGVAKPSAQGQATTCIQYRGIVTTACKDQ
uniref:Uncharacterized protein n=1 Tax=Rhizophora mucronata TaxID=61149 RepID=A0A2P2KHV9_RHIMU